MHGTLYITGDPRADDLLNTEPLALVLGMLLDQNVQQRRRRSRRRTPVDQTAWVTSR